MHLTPHRLEVEKKHQLFRWHCVVLRHAMLHAWFSSVSWTCTTDIVQQWRLKIAMINEGKGERGQKRDSKLCRLMKQPVSDDQKYDPMTERWCVTSVSCNYITLVAFVVNVPFWPLCNESDKTRYWHFLEGEFSEMKVLQSSRVGAAPVIKILSN